MLHVILLKLFPICRHNDLPWNVRKFVHNQLGEVNLSSDLGRVDPWARSDWSHTDIPRLRAGLVGAQVNSTWHSLGSCSPPFLSVGCYFHFFSRTAPSVPAFQYLLAISMLIHVTSHIHGSKTHYFIKNRSNRDITSF